MQRIEHAMNSSEPRASVVPGMDIEGLKSFIYLQYNQVSLFWGNWKLYVLRNFI